MQIQCPKCHNVTSAEGVSLDVVEFGCPSCRSLISYAKNPEGRVEQVFDSPTYLPDLKVGMKGTFDGIEYTVTGVVVKQVQRHYYWREYILTAAEHPQLYLSETDGHWIALKQVDDKYEVQGYPEEYTYDGMSMKLYDYDDPRIYTAEGFFDYDVKQHRMVEYIKPPYIYSVEVSGTQTTSYFGEHIEPYKIRTAFGVKSLKSRVGVGIVQPFAVNLRSMGIIFCAAAIVILVTHLFIYSGKESTPVLNQAISFDEYSTKDFVSQPFTLEGGSAPMTIRVHSDINNSWAAVQVVLVNEITNEAEIAAKDIEYYHGSSGGESWSEGNTSETFNICGVEAGRYHLVLTPQKPPEDATNSKIDVLAEWDQPTAWNMVIPIVVMLIAFAITFFANMNFNQRRWADSSYSPYNTEE